MVSAAIVSVTAFTPVMTSSGSNSNRNLHRERDKGETRDHARVPACARGPHDTYSHYRCPCLANGNGASGLVGRDGIPWFTFRTVCTTQPGRIQPSQDAYNPARKPAATPTPPTLATVQEQCPHLVPLMLRLRLWTMRGKYRTLHRATRETNTAVAPASTLDALLRRSFGTIFFKST